MSSGWSAAWWGATSTSTALAEAGEYCDYLSIHHYGHGGYENAAASNLQMETWFKGLHERMKRLVPGRKIQLAFDEWNSGTTEYYYGLAAPGYLNPSLASSPLAACDPDLLSLSEFGGQPEPGSRHRAAFCGQT